MGFGRWNTWERVVAGGDLQVELWGREGERWELLTLFDQGSNPLTVLNNKRVGWLGYGVDW